MSESDDMSELGSIIERITKDEVPIKNIERELICPGCKELFTHPLILPCQHSVCHKCVKEVLLLTHEDSFTDAGSECSNSGSPRSRLSSPSIDRLDRLGRSASLRRSFGRRGRIGFHLFSSYRSSTPTGKKRNSLIPRVTNFPCPGCQHDIDLGERGISGLFRNFTLENIVERYRQAARAAVAIMCNLCKPPPVEATKSCMDCKASYCNECFKMHHPWGTPKAQHEYVGPTTNFRPKVLMCPEHEMEKVNMYCEVCRRPVCHLCKLGGSHANHKVTSMSSAYKLLKEKLSRSIHYLISKEDQVKTQISELDELITHTQHNGETSTREANLHFETLFNILEERKTEMLRTIEVNQTTRLEKLKSQREEYQGMLENSGLVGYAQEVLKETDQSCFVQTAKQLYPRIQKATEALRSFHPAADPSFGDFAVDVSKEEVLLKELGFSIPDVPVIDQSLSRVYNEGLICWLLPEDSSPTDHYILEYKKLDDKAETTWLATEKIYGNSKVVCDLDTNSLYNFRVKSCKKSVYSSYSQEVAFHTPPAPVFSFLFDDKCGFNTERLILNRRQSVESVAGLSLLLGSERIQMGSYMCLDYIIGDTGIDRGSHFWVFRVEPHSYLVKVGVASDTKLQEWFHNPRDTSSPRYDHDSGHDSGSEDTCYDSSQPFTLVTIGMGKFIIPKGSTATTSDYSNRVLPTPQRIGICLDYEKGRVYFYDADNMKCLWERQVDCTGTMYPAFGLMGSGGVHLEEIILGKRLGYTGDAQ
ncbi:E3 ubiquitin-protein ligase TRIM36-like isoform X1 [Acipenser ruthenus]|uniref:E3 ubiquitin-protein ligase TRIM36-like isoform X1 n=1 Tax=Acipenser ruthenus TaxID=7906 RepID=UPI00274062D6|nr:E3 ubiquitin-protein ligase TRIM36-like isoform X1 [Acipenser ruthenus]